MVALDDKLALSAAMLGAEYKLPLAGSTTAQQLDAIVWTQDDDFDGLPNVKYFRKHTPSRRP